MTARSAMRILVLAVAALLVLAALLAGGALVWLGTQPALEWLARQAVAAAGGRLALDGVRGSLYGRISVSRVAFKDATLDFEARAVAIEWQPLALLRREMRITGLTIDKLRIATAPAAEGQPPRLPAQLRLPLLASVADARVKRIEIVPGRFVQDLHFRLSAGAETHELELVQVAAMGWRASGKVRLAAADPFAVAGTLDLQSKARGGLLQVRVTLGGRLDALQLEASTAARGATARAEGLLRPFAALPLEKVTLEARDLDLAAWDKALPRTKLAVSIAAGMNAPEQFSGTARMENSIPGPVSAQRVPPSRVAFSFSGGGTHWMLSDLDLGIGKTGRVRGSGSVEGANARLELTLANIEVADLHGQLKPLAVSGRVTLIGDADAQRTVATLEGAGARLELAARHVQQVITVERGELRAPGGRLEFTGYAALTGKREFSVNAKFSGLDPARFIDAPPARLNGKISAQGRLVPEWEAQLRLAVTDSRLRGHLFAANAEFTSSAKQPFSGEARAVLAGNRLDVSGGYGMPGDTLKWSLGAANLHAIDGKFSGNIKGHGTLAGSIEQPAVAFNLTAQRLALGEFAARSIDAQGVVESGADGALRFTARFAGIQARAVKLDELQIDAQGTRLRHEVTAALRGSDFDASLAGAGGVDERWHWNGRLSALAVRGRTPFRLTSPARISAGRGVLLIEDLRAAALGGEIGPAQLHIEDGRIRTRGALRGITAKALLAFAPQTEIDARDLAIGGRWQFELADTVSGDAEIFREAGDLGLRTESKLPFELQQLQLSLRARDNALEVVLDARSTRLGVLSGRLGTRVARRDGAWVLTRDAPLDGHLALDMRSLAWVRALVPRLDQVDGRIAARLTVTGTAAQPLVSGSASADEVEVRAIGPGLHLSDGTLRASVEGKTLKVTRLFLKAGDGKIEADGVADLTDGLRSFEITARAARARILASPQLTLVLSGIGHAGLRDLKLALEGKFKVDEGRYDLGAERKPELGDDVAVLGQAPAARPNPIRIMLDLAVDLNDKFAVRGYGLDAVLGGSIRLATRGGALHALGTIRTVRGEYFAFGQLLGIQRGELNFSGPLGNPGLDLRAARRIKSVEVGVEVGGSLERPVVKLVSDPAMPDSDRLGWLVLGRDPATASAAELAILQAAALTAGARRTTPLQKRIAEDLGLDDFGVSQGAAGAFGVVALGKRITERLTLRLEQTLGGTAESSLKIAYLLSERWRLEGTTGAKNAADVLFTLRFD